MNVIAQTFSAPAKINTHLRVEGLTAQGLHLLDTGFIFVDLCDKIHIEHAPTLEVTCSIATLSGKHNLVYKILDGLRQRFAIKQGLDVFIEKHIPEQAGLGGGSSDAATAMMVALQYWNLSMTMQERIDFATPYGADIPCFLYGKPSLAYGIGERLQAHPQAEQEKRLKGFVCLAKPAHGLSTKAVFEHFDSIHGLTLESTADTMRANSQVERLNDSEIYPDLGVNMLEASAASLLPELARLLEYLKQSGVPAWMSGSGSTCIAICPTQEQANALAQTLQAKQLANWTYTGKLITDHPLMVELTGT